MGLCFPAKGFSRKHSFMILVLATGFSPFPFQIMTLAIYLFPTCGTRPGDQLHVLLENLVRGVCLLNIPCQVACRMHAWYRALCSRFNLLHRLNDGEAELARLRMGFTVVPRSILKPLHCVNASA